MRLLDLLGALAALGAMVLAVGVLVRRVWSRLPAAEPLEPDEPEPVGFTDPRGPLSTLRRRTCLYCAGTPTRYGVTIVEHRAAAELLSRLLPIGLVVSRLRRATSWEAVPTVCELHGALAEAGIDAYLTEEDATLARAVRSRAARAHAFVSTELPRLLREPKA